MILSIKQLTQLNFIPKTGYKIGKAFPENFQLPKTVANDIWKKLPLFIQVRYNYDAIDNFHLLKGAYND